MRLSPFLALATLAAASLAARADTVYNYTGQYFTTVSGDYTTSDRVTGSFTVASPLGDNLTGYSFTPESFSFSDGQQTVISDSLFLSSYTFQVSTDSTGAITGYDIYLDVFSPLSIYISLQDTATHASDVGSDFLAGSGTSIGAGSFVESGSAVTPEPSSIALLGTGLLGMAGFLRKRFA